jgi:enoyl reductase-like protein
VLIKPHLFWKPLLENDIAVWVRAGALWQDNRGRQAAGRIRLRST